MGFWVECGLGIACCVSHHITSHHITSHHITSQYLKERTEDVVKEDLKVGQLSVLCIHAAAPHADERMEVVCGCRWVVQEAGDLDEPLDIG